MQISSLVFFMLISMIKNYSPKVELNSLSKYEDIEISQLSSGVMVILMDEKIQQSYQKILGIMSAEFNIIHSQSVRNSLTSHGDLIYVLIQSQGSNSQTLSCYNKQLVLLQSYPLSNAYLDNTLYKSLLYQPIKQLSIQIYNEQQFIKSVYLQDSNQLVNTDISPVLIPHSSSFSLVYAVADNNSYHRILMKTLDNDLKEQSSYVELQDKVKQIKEMKSVQIQGQIVVVFDYMNSNEEGEYGLEYQVYDRQSESHKVKLNLEKHYKQIFNLQIMVYKDRYTVISYILKDKSDQYKNKIQIVDIQEDKVIQQIEKESPNENSKMKVLIRKAQVYGIYEQLIDGKYTYYKIDEDILENLNEDSHDIGKMIAGLSVVIFILVAVIIRCKIRKVKKRAQKKGIYRHNGSKGVSRGGSRPSTAQSNNSHLSRKRPSSQHSQKTLRNSKLSDNQVKTQTNQSQITPNQKRLETIQDIENQQEVTFNQIDQKVQETEYFITDHQNYAEKDKDDEEFNKIIQEDKNIYDDSFNITDNKDQKEEEFSINNKNISALLQYNVKENKETDSQTIQFQD